LIQQRAIDLSKVTISVLDEADHMCDLGFLEPVQRILRQTAPKGQRLLFSATLDKGVAVIGGRHRRQITETFGSIYAHNRDE
jgi:superfamily II DNA/RNA helicase